MEQLFYLRESVHYFLHFIFPYFIASIFFRENWRRAYLLMLGTMLVDADHLLANPIFDPNRGSVGFHVLHTYPMVLLYFLGTLFLKGKYRIVSLGLFLHMLTDFQNYYLWK
ncbi:hypothetical protein CO230_00420 [Chryseobacterium sp. 6424]|uniref:DUF6122 family protein n=1 Tax=Chryseobacterium sp. 6424 TaxID=2039166 RepID=UPI000EFC9486|nr:DUF6122 family protein [Chryseobacterium sp. 6424]AYO56734.1 hypothetical protein CO230_00420 [Chryseobacterium sp. 6424]